MRHYKIIPTVQITAASLSKDGLKRLDWMGTGERIEEIHAQHFGGGSFDFDRAWANTGR